MHRNKLLLLAFIIIGCNNVVSDKQHCNLMSINLGSYTNKEVYKISFCVEDSFKEISSIQWGVRLSKQFQNKNEKIYIAFPDNDKILSDSLMNRNGIAFCKAALLDSHFNSQEKIIINANTDGVLTSFNKDSIFISIFHGFNRDGNISFEVVTQTYGNNHFAKNIVESFNFKRIKKND